MNPRHNTAALLRHQRRFHNLVAQCSREDLAQCLRLLGMYLSLYKSRFGGMEDPVYAKLLASVNTDAELAQLCSAGLDEAIAMLSTINLHAKPASPPLPAAVN